MSRATLLATGLAVVGLALWSDLAQAQMFGRRQLGRPLARRNPPGMEVEQQDVGSLQGNERFLRRNRTPADFVGPDIRELERFIGMLQASIRGQALSATQDVRRRVDRSATVNQPLTPVPQRGTMYNPQLDVQVSTPLSSLSSDATASSAWDTLVRSTRLSGSSRISVSVVDRIAILQGEVPSVEDRDLAAALLSFEPGIGAIQNDLVVNPQLANAPQADSLQNWRDRQQPAGTWTTLSHGSTKSTQTRSWNSVLREQQ